MKVSCPYLGNMGRLGNQLFQLASTVGIAASQGATIQLPQWDYQQYFNVPEEWFGGVDPDAVSASTFAQHLDPQNRDYLQDYNLFKHIASDLREWLTPSPLALDILGPYFKSIPFDVPQLGMHVRRGDNAYEGEWKAQYHPLRPLSYYFDALTIMKEERGYDQGIVVFSDDIPWCREAFKEVEECHFFEGGAVRAKEHEAGYKADPFNDWIDLFIMAHGTDGQIISNSTYAWWAAFLSGTTDVIYPDPWFGPALSFIDASLMMPSGWTKLTHVT